MKIAHVVSSGGLYGKERMILALIKEQLHNGDEPYVIVMDGKELYTKASKITNSIYVTSVLSIFRAINQCQPDVIHTHDYKSGIIVGIRKLGSVNYPPVIRTLHGYTNTAKTIFNRMFFYEALDKFTHQFNNKVIGVSSEMGHVFNIEHINNGLPFWIKHQATTHRADILELCDGSFVVGCMARLSAEKNLINLVTAMTHLKDDIKLVIFGDGPQRSELERLIASLGLSSRVILAGYDPKASKYLDLMDVYIQPSLTEGTPISILEAMSAQVPLIMTKVGGMKHILKSSAGLPCGFGPEEIADAIRIMEENQQLRLDIANQAQEVFRQEYSSESMAKQYSEVYQSLISEG